MLKQKKDEEIVQKWTRRHRKERESFSEINLEEGMRNAKKKYQIRWNKILEWVLFFCFLKINERIVDKDDGEIYYIIVLFYLEFLIYFYFIAFILVSKINKNPINIIFFWIFSSFNSSHHNWLGCKCIRVRRFNQS